MLVGQHGGQEIGRGVDGEQQGHAQGSPAGQQAQGDAEDQYASAPQPHRVHHLKGQLPWAENPQQQALVKGKPGLIGPVVVVDVLQIVPSAPGHVLGGGVHGVEVLHRLGADRQNHRHGQAEPNQEQGGAGAPISQGPEPHGQSQHRRRADSPRRRHQGVGAQGCQNALSRDDPAEEDGAQQADPLAQPADVSLHIKNLHGMN